MTEASYHSSFQTKLPVKLSKNMWITVLYGPQLQTLIIKISHYSGHFSFSRKIMCFILEAHFLGSVMMFVSCHMLRDPQNTCFQYKIRLIYIFKYTIIIFNEPCTRDALIHVICLKYQSNWQLFHLLAVLEAEHRMPTLTLSLEMPIRRGATYF